ncbi:MAG: TRAP transporter substrate-binding protein [Enterocloster asparagiformis]|nr:TRAP transporter substrate-binding protein [Enterocloster asparagiformis]
MMKKTLATLLSLTAAFALSACGGSQTPGTEAAGSPPPSSQASQDAQTSAAGNSVEACTLTFSTTMSQGTTNVDYFDKALDLITEQSGGAIQFSRTYSGTLGGEHDLGVMCMDGDLDIVCVGPGNLADWDTAFQVFDCPFLFHDFDHYDAVLNDSAYQAWLDEKGAGLGITFLMTGNQGFKGIINSKHAVHSPADLKDLKIRVPDSSSLIEIGAAMGYVPTPVAATDQYMSLSQGIIDGADHSMVAHLNWKLTELAKYFTETNHNLQSTFLFINREKLESLPPEYQEIILSACSRMQDEMNKQTRTDAEESFSKAADEGVEIIPYSDVDVDAFKSALSEIITKYSAADEKLYQIIVEAGK